MKTIFCFLLLTVVCHCFNEEDEWMLFKKTYKKSYNTVGEDIRRMEIYFQNKKLIEEHNDKYAKGLVPYSLKMNHYGDFLHEEFLESMSGYNKPYIPYISATYYENDNVTELPQEVDWRAKGAVTEVKNQLQCGSGWAFSAAGALESQLFLKTGELVPLSAQQLLDCVHHTGACYGGNAQAAFDYTMNKGLISESSYPYKGMEFWCRYKSNKVAVQNSGFVLLPPGDEEALKNVVANVGPVSVVLDSSNWSFKFYSEGIYESDDCSPKNLNHGVLAVGYGTDNGQDYWLLKNSWGSSWGDQGYFKIARNKNNKCGVTSAAVYPSL